MRGAQLFLGPDYEAFISILYSYCNRFHFFIQLLFWYHCSMYMYVPYFVKHSSVSMNFIAYNLVSVHPSSFTQPAYNMRLIKDICLTRQRQVFVCQTQGQTVLTIVPPLVITHHLKDKIDKMRWSGKVRRIVHQNSNGFVTYLPTACLQISFS